MTGAAKGPACLHPAEAFEALRDVVYASTEKYGRYDVVVHVSLDQQDAVMLRIVCGEHGYQVPHRGRCPKCGGVGLPAHMIPVNPPWSTEPEKEDPSV